VALVIEVVDRHAHVTQRYFFCHREVTFGRAYDNDVILDDLHVDACHAKLILGEQGDLRLQDNRSLNGIRLRRGSRANNTHFDLRFGEEFCLGDTWIRVVDPKRQVPQAKSLQGDTPLLKSLHSLWFSVAVSVLAIAWLMYQEYLKTVEEIEVDALVTQLFGLASVLILSALGLSFLGRVLRRQSLFSFNLSLVSGSLVLIILGEYLLKIALFNVSLPALYWWLDLLWVAAVVALFCWGLTYSVVKMIRVKQILLIAATPLLLVMLSAITHHYDEHRKFHYRPALSVAFLPESYRFSRPISDEAFLLQVQSVFNIEFEDETDDEPVNETDSGQ